MSKPRNFEDVLKAIKSQIPSDCKNKLAVDVILCDIEISALYAAPEDDQLLWSRLSSLTGEINEFKSELTGWQKIIYDLLMGKEDHLKYLPKEEKVDDNIKRICKNVEVRQILPGIYKMLNAKSCGETTDGNLDGLQKFLVTLSQKTESS